MIYSWNILPIWGLPIWGIGILSILLLVGVVGLIWRKSRRKGELEQKQHGTGFAVGTFSADTEAQRHPVDIQ